MKKFVLTVLILACTAAYADNEKNQGNGPPGLSRTSTAIAGSESTSGATSNSTSGAVATGGQAVAGSTATNGNQTLTGGNSTSSATLTGGNSTSTSSGGQASSTALGGTATGGNATGGSATGGTAVGGQGGSGGVSSSVAAGGQGGSGGMGGVGGSSNATAGGGTGGQGGLGGSSTSTTGPVSTTVGVTVSTGNTTNQTDKEIAAGHDQAARDVANSKIRNTPSMFGPALVSSNDTCMGSTSGSVATPGLGLSFGSTWVDENCKMLKNSERLWNMGLKAASIALLCTDEKIKESLEITGFPCPVRPPITRTQAPN